VTEDSLAIRRHLDGLVVRIAALARRHGNITLLDFVDPPSEAGDRFETLLIRELAPAGRQRSVQVAACIASAAAGLRRRAVLDPSSRRRASDDPRHRASDHRSPSTSRSEGSGRKT
jgi:hypothetical protein